MFVCRYQKRRVRLLEIAFKPHSDAIAPLRTHSLDVKVNQSEECEAELCSGLTQRMLSG